MNSPYLRAFFVLCERTVWHGVRVVKCGKRYLTTYTRIAWEVTFMKNLLLISGILISMILLPNPTRGDVSLLVLEAVGVAGEYTGSGHTAIYLSNICAETPVKLRPCRQGEAGVVISSYPSFSDGKSYEWIAIPLNPFLYGVEDEADIPLYANGEIRNFMRENYRQNHLRDLVPDSPDGSMPKGDWKIMLTAVFNRDVYSLTVQTTPEEDAKFLEKFNSRPNDGNFNTLTNNCADFARSTLNTYFPGATRRDWINDIGITTPKAVARSFTRYAKKRPERLFYITRYPQTQGTIWRSFDNRNFTEMAFKSKKYLIPSLIFEPSLVPIFSIVYYVTGRFDLHKAYLESPSPAIAKLNRSKKVLNDPRIMYFNASTRTEDVAKALERERFTVFGSKESWKAHKTNFAPMLNKAIQQKVFQDTGEVNSFFRDLEFMGEPALDANGHLILKVNYYGQMRQVGLTRENLLDPNSDRELALKLVMAKINADLNASEKNRRLYPDFWFDWQLMNQIMGEQTPVFAGIDKNRGRFVKNPPKINVKREIEKLMIAITH